MSIDEALLKYLTTFRRVELESTDPISDFIRLEHPAIKQYVEEMPVKDHSDVSTGDANNATNPALCSVKKAHEVDRMVKRIEGLAQEHSFEFILDAGAGVSHLSRSLSFHNFKVIALEHDGSRVQNARRLDVLMGSKIKYISSFDELSKITAWIDSVKSSNTETPKCLIVGLHLCGDFCADVLQYMVSECRAGSRTGLDIVGCCLVGCCFHRCTKFTSTRFMQTANIDSMQFEFLGKQDLRRLSDEEIIRLYDATECWTLGFKTWCFYMGFLAYYLENLIHEDRVSYLKENEFELVTLQQMFSFNISTQNLALTAFKNPKAYNPK